LIFHIRCLYPTVRKLVHDTKIYKNKCVLQQTGYLHYFQISDNCILNIQNNKDNSTTGTRLQKHFYIRKKQSSLLAIDKENHHNMLPDRDKLQTCVRDTRIHAIKTSPFIMRKRMHPARCKYIWKRRDRSKIAKRNKYYPKPLCVTLTEEESWLYSTLNPQKMTINAKTK